MDDPNARLYVYKAFFEPYLYSGCYEVREKTNEIQKSLKGIEILKTLNRSYMKKGKISAEFTFNILVDSRVENPDEITKKVKSKLEENLKCRLEEVGEK
jgi:heterodisulfide reductase subunit B